MATQLEELGKRLGAREALTATELDQVVSIRDLIALGTLADDCRRQRHGDRVTFVRVQAVVCSSPADTVDLCPEAGEVRLVGDVTSREQAVDATRRVVAACDTVPVTGFELDQLAGVCAGDGDSLAELLVELAHVGLAMVSDARADVDRMPEWLEIAGSVGMDVARLTIGVSEEREGVELIRRVATWGEVVSRVHAVSPLSPVVGSQPTTGYSDVRRVALARLLVDNIDSIQVDWGQYGPKLAQVALTVGADDLDAVSPSDESPEGWRRGPLEEVTRNIRAAGFVPVRRNGRFVMMDE